MFNFFYNIHPISRDGSSKISKSNFEIFEEPSLSPVNNKHDMVNNNIIKLKWKVVYMPRTARLKGPQCTYHIIVRGNNRGNLFNDDEDRLRYLTTLKRFKVKYDFLLYAYVLMDNHVHMIINSNNEDISKIMQSIEISYTYYFNKKYNRVGHLFQDRFKSIIINDDSYIVNLSKYIHNNPKRARLVPYGSDYIWSSCRAYTSFGYDGLKILDTGFILGYFSKNVKLSKLRYLSYMLDDSDDHAIDKMLKDDINKNSCKKIKNVQKLNIRSIISAVASFYRLPVDDILMRNNKRHSNIRNECLYIVRMKSGETNDRIGKVFGNICGGAVTYGISKTIQRMMDDDSTFDRIVGMLDSIG